MDGQEPLSLRPGHDLGRPPGPLTFETLGSFSTMAQMPAWPCAKLPFFSHGSKSPKGGGEDTVYFSSWSSNCRGCGPRSPPPGQVQDVGRPDALLAPPRPEAAEVGGTSRLLQDDQGSGWKPSPQMGEQADGEGGRSLCPAQTQTKPLCVCGGGVPGRARSP